MAKKKKRQRRRPVRRKAKRTPRKERQLREAAARWRRWDRAARRSRMGGTAHKRAVRYRAQAARRIAALEDELGQVVERPGPVEDVGRRLLDVTHDLGPEEMDLEAEGVEFELRAESEGDTGKKGGRR